MAEFFNLDISLIDEDPEQPRRCGNAGFSEKSIKSFFWKSIVASN